MQEQDRLIEDSSEPGEKNDQLPGTMGDFYIKGDSSKDLPSIPSRVNIIDVV